MHFLFFEIFIIVETVCRRSLFSMNKMEGGERNSRGRKRHREKSKGKRERENFNCFLLIDDVVAMETPIKKQVENYRLFKLQRNRYAHTSLINYS